MGFAGHWKYGELRTNLNLPLRKTGLTNEEMRLGGRRGQVPLTSRGLCDGTMGFVWLGSLHCLLHPTGGIQLAEQGSCFLSIFKLIWV